MHSKQIFVGGEPWGTAPDNVDVLVLVVGHGGDDENRGLVRGEST